jgi:hypothetical protein
MMYVSTIIAINEDIAKEAEIEEIEPYEWQEGDGIDELRRIPSIGYYEPPGWEQVLVHFVDSSGFGQESEPALTIDQLLVRMIPGYGYAITEEGQFQVYITQFQRV